MGELYAGLIGSIIGAVIFAAGAWFRHRYIKPDPPACPPRDGNPWVIPTGEEG